MPASHGPATAPAYAGMAPGNYRGAPKLRRYPTNKAEGGEVPEQSVRPSGPSVRGSQSQHGEGRHCPRHPVCHGGDKLHLSNGHNRWRKGPGGHPWLELRDGAFQTRKYFLLHLVAERRQAPAGSPAGSQIIKPRSLQTRGLSSEASTKAASSTRAVWRRHGGGCEPV